MATAERSLRRYGAISLPLRRVLSTFDRAPAAAYFAATCVAALVLYSQTLTHAFEFDDINVLYKAIVRAPNLLYLFTQFDGQTTGGSWRPLLHVVLWLEWHVFGTGAIYYHAINVLLHACTVFVLAAIAFELTGRQAIARIVGAIFLVQPLPEAVAWIVAGPLNVMSVLFYLAGLLFHIRARRHGHLRGELIALAFLVLSFLSYEVALTFIAPIIAYDVLFHWREWTWRQRFVRMGAMALAVLGVDVLFAVTRAWILGVFLGSYGATAVFGFASIPTRFQTVLNALWAPANNSMSSTSIVERAEFLFQFALAAAVVAAVVLRPPVRPILLGVFISICALVPFAGFIAITPGLISTRYLYLAIAGVVLAVGTAFGARPLLGAIAAAILVASSAVVSLFNQMPWAVAGAMVESTVKAASAGPLQAFGVPIHDYHGAYTFGTATNVPEYPGAYGIDVLTDTSAIQPGRNLMYWDGSGSLVSLDTPPIVAWSAAALREWNWAPSTKIDLSGDDLVVTSSDGDPWAWSPTLALPSERTNVVVIALDVSPQNTCKRAQLISRFALTGDRNVTVVVAPGLNDYVFVEPTPVLGDTLIGLRFDALLCPGTARIVRVEVGGRGART